MGFKFSRGWKKFVPQIFKRILDPASRVTKQFWKNPLSSQLQKTKSGKSEIQEKQEQPMDFSLSMDELTKIKEVASDFFIFYFICLKTEKWICMRPKIILTINFWVNFRVIERNKYFTMTHPLVHQHVSQWTSSYFHLMLPQIHRPPLGLDFLAFQWSLPKAQN